MESGPCTWPGTCQSPAPLRSLRSIMPSTTSSEMSQPNVQLMAGYDMEDAMILNRAAIDRGLARGYVYKTEVLDLKEEKGPVRFAVPRPKPQKGAPVAPDKPSTIFGQKFPQNLATQVQLHSCGPNSLLCCCSSAATMPCYLGVTGWLPCSNDSCWMPCPLHHADGWQRPMIAQLGDQALE